MIIFRCRDRAAAAVSALALASLMILAPSAATADEEKPALKVCADPYMLPFSNRDGQGYENEIAQLFAEELGWDLEYEWFPQRMGFIRNTLRSENTDGSYKCDIVMNVPEQFDIGGVDTTDPYYTSTYALVYAPDRGIGELERPEDLRELAESGKDLKIGVTDRGPAQLWVFRNGLMGNIVPYYGQPGDPKVSPGETLVREIVAGNIDAALVWGPTAGYWAQELKDQVELVVLPLHDNPRYPDMKFELSMSMGVRAGEPEWKRQVERFIEDNRSKINDILKKYGIPLLTLKKAPARADDDD